MTLSTLSGQSNVIFSATTEKKSITIPECPTFVSSRRRQKTLGDGKHMINKNYSELQCGHYKLGCSVILTLSSKVFRSCILGIHSLNVYKIEVEHRKTLHYSVSTKGKLKVISIGKHSVILSLP
jgi:hypothetical protein